MAALGAASPVAGVWEAITKTLSGEDEAEQETAVRPDSSSTIHVAENSGLWESLKSKMSEQMSEHSRSSSKPVAPPPQDAETTSKVKPKNSIRSMFLREHDTKEETVEFRSTPSVTSDTAKTVGESVVSVVSQKSDLPQRLVDYFCVIGPELRIDPLQKDFAKSKSPCDLRLKASVLDTFPEARGDMEFPSHLPTFCFPHSCRPVLEPQAPSIFSTVLTTGTGQRLYTTILTLYEDTLTLQDFSEFFWAEGKTMPKWLLSTKKDNEDGTNTSSLTSTFYLPKCLVVVSHHAFFTVQAQFLKQLLRIYHSGTCPLPLERYIANFCDDIPLPPLGHSSVVWKCFTNDTSIQFSRPAPNELPLLNSSFQPLFRCLSVSNIMTLWGVLLQEGRVVICSKHVSLLTPVAEALLSILFPLNWQSIYIPVLPDHMTDVLDAPVPFLIGMQGECNYQPPGVVVCDLDEDIVHLGLDDYNEIGSMPKIPDAQAMKLRVELEEVADPLYLVTKSGVKGRMTHGQQQEHLHNSEREPYAQMTRLRKNESKANHRNYILSHGEHVTSYFSPLGSQDYMDHSEELVRNRSTGSTERKEPKGYSSTVLGSLKIQQRSLQAHTDQLLAKAGQKYATPSSHEGCETDRTLEKKKYEIARTFFDLDEELALYARHAFLRFFTTLLDQYKSCCNPEFQHNTFLNSLNMSNPNRLCVDSIIKTQMFERFLHESSTRRRLFDDLVVRNRNQSFWSGNDERTPFLNETRWQRKQIITPAAPVAAGIRKNRKFCYPAFPRLDKDELVSNTNKSGTFLFRYCGQTSCLGSCGIF